MTTRTEFEGHSAQMYQSRGSLETHNWQPTGWLQTVVLVVVVWFRCLVENKSKPKLNLRISRKAWKHKRREGGKGEGREGRRKGRRKRLWAPHRRRSQWGSWLLDTGLSAEAGGGGAGRINGNDNVLETHSLKAERRWPPDSLILEQTLHKTFWKGKKENKRNGE